MSEHAPCIVCGGPVARREREGMGQYLMRKFCSRDCVNEDFRQRAIETTVYPPHAPCPTCGAAIVPRPGEKPFVYNKRKTCGGDCAIVAGAKSTSDTLRREINKWVLVPHALADPFEGLGDCFANNVTIKIVAGGIGQRPETIVPRGER